MLLFPSEELSTFSRQVQAVIATIFWLKARAGWHEVQRHEHAGVPHQPITEIRRIIISGPDPQKLKAMPGICRDNPAYLKVINGPSSDT